MYRIYFKIELDQIYNAVRFVYFYDASQHPVTWWTGCKPTKDRGPYRHITGFILVWKL